MQVIVVTLFSGYIYTVVNMVQYPFQLPKRDAEMA